MALAVAVAGCSGGGGGGGGAAGGGGKRTDLVVSFSQEPSDWNYVRNVSTSIRSLLVHNVLEPLLEKKADGSLQPLLAESYQVSGDGRAYTFKIRKATFHDGSALSADDVVYSLNFNRSSSSIDVSGPFQAVKSVEKVDDQTVKVVLKQPSQAFLAGLSGDSGLIIPSGGEKTLNKHPVGTGPFVFEEWKNGVQVTLKRYEQYWGKKPFFQNVRWRFMLDQTAAANALLAGDVDMIGEPSKEARDRVMKRSGFASTETPTSEIGYVSLNAKDKAFQDVRVRQAIAHAIDRKSFIAGTNPDAKPTCVLVNPPTEPWNSDHCPYTYDPEKTRQLLAEAGVKDLTLKFSYISAYPSGFEILSQQFKNVGIKTEPRALELATYLDRVMGKADYSFTQIQGPQKMDTWKCPGFFTQDCAKEFDDLLSRADASLDREQWISLRRKAAELQADRAFVIPLYTTSNTMVERDNLVGFKPYRSSSEIDLRTLTWREG